MPSFSRILAADLGVSAVRLLEIGPDSQGRPIVMALSEEEISFDPAKTPDFASYAQALGAAVGRLPSKTRRCHLCLGGPAVFARILKVPAADPGRVRSMIGFEAQQTVPAIEQALWDYQLLSTSQPGEVEALILAIKKETAEELSAAAASVGLMPDSVTLAPAGLLDGFFFNYPEASGCNLILDIGARATTILLVEGARLFVRVVPLGGGSVSQAVAADLQESFAGAEVLKRAKGFVHPGGAYEDSADAVAARIAKLARGVMTRLHAEVERSTTFFRSQQGGGKPTQAWITGGGATLGYTDLFFREKLRIPVDFFQPFRRLPLPGGPEAETAARHFPRWATVVGTALQSLPEAPVRINVLGAAGRATAQKARDLPARLLAVFSAILLLFLPAGHSLWQSAKTGRQLANDTLRVEEASRALEGLEKENKKVLGLLQRMETAVTLERERLRWPLLLEEVKRHSPKRLWITRLGVVPKEAGQVPPPGVPGKPKESAIPLVEISGMFETQSEKADAEAVAKFQTALGEGGVLRNVRVLERETPKYVDGKTDQVALKFRLQAEWPLPPPERVTGPGVGP